MAVYTHFGGMGELRRAVRWSGFAALAGDLAAVGRTQDPVADLVKLCHAYYVNGTRNPELYRVMFMEQALDEHDVEVCAGTFETLVAGVRRCIESGRFSADDPVALATELWVTGHGLVSLELSQSLAPQQAADSLSDVLVHLLSAFGADRAEVEGALAHIRQPRHSSH
jgi:hypothetical protein